MIYQFLLMGWYALMIMIVSSSYIRKDKREELGPLGVLIVRLAVLGMLSIPVYLGYMVGVTAE